MARKDDKKPKPHRTGKPLSVWLKTEMREALDAFVGSHDPQPKLTSVIETALRKFLESKGFWPPPAAAE